jgi:hypothetical protein
MVGITKGGGEPGAGENPSSRPGLVLHPRLSRVVTGAVSWLMLCLGEVGKGRFACGVKPGGQDGE